MKGENMDIEITTLEDPETVTIGTLNAAIEAERARCVAIVTEMVELEYGGVVHANIDKAYRILTLGERVVAAIMERGQ